jgi:surfeit locus 1 family protein
VTKPPEAMLAGSMYGFVFERRWFAGFILVLAIAAGCVRLGFWQLDRLQQSKATQRLTAERQSMPVEPLTARTPSADAGERRVQASGRFDAGNEIVLAARAYKGTPGRHLLTPLILDDGTAVIVDRGWIPEEVEPSIAPPPADRVVLEGLLLPSEPRGFMTGRPDLTTHRTLARIDLEAIAGSVPYPVYPLWLLPEEQAAEGELPIVAELPKPDEPPHLSYAIQWFLFAATGLVGYCALARREAKERLAGTQEDEAGPDPTATSGDAPGGEENLPAVPR